LRTVESRSATNRFASATRASSVLTGAGAGAGAGVGSGAGGAERWSHAAARIKAETRVVLRTAELYARIAPRAQAQHRTASPGHSPRRRARPSGPRRIGAHAREGDRDARGLVIAGSDDAGAVGLNAALTMMA